MVSVEVISFMPDGVVLMRIVKRVGGIRADTKVNSGCTENGEITPRVGSWDKFGTTEAKLRSVWNWIEDGFVGYCCEDRLGECSWVSGGDIEECWRTNWGL